MHSKLFQGSVAEVYLRMWYLEWSGGILPQENFVTLDARRSLLIAVIIEANRRLIHFASTE